MTVLRRFGFESLGLKAADFGPDAVIQLGQPPRRIDLPTAIDGVESEACWGRREHVTVDGVALASIGLEDFAANKRSSGRLKDLADLESLGLTGKGKARGTEAD